MRAPKLVAVDLRKTVVAGGTTTHPDITPGKHPGITPGQMYLVLYNDQFYAGRFSRQWYGLNFEGIYDAGCQFDAPGTNKSRWQAVWKIVHRRRKK